MYSILNFTFKERKSFLLPYQNWAPSFIIHPLFKEVWNKQVANSFPLLAFLSP